MLFKTKIEFDHGDTSNLQTMRVFFINIREINWLEYILLLINGIFFMVWFKSAFDNLEKLDVGIRNGGTMTYLSWFIPIISYVVPYQIMVDIWRGNNQMLVKLNSANSNQNSSTKPLKIWWALWVTGSAAAFLGFIFIRIESTVNAGFVLYILSVAAPLLAGVFLIGIMKKMNEMESEVFDKSDILLAEAYEIHKEKVKIARAKAAQVQAAAQQRRAGMRPPR